MDPSPVLLVDGERVALGPLRRDLAALYTSWDNDLELAALRGREIRPRGVEEWNEILDRQAADAARVFFTIYETVYEHKAPRAIGVSMLLRIDRAHATAELGIYLGERDTWSTGVGTEATRLTLDYAFHGLGLGNVALRVIATNARAIKAYERAGFKAIGRQRGSYRLGGRAYDELLMDCVAAEFESPVLAKLWTRALGSSAPSSP